MEKLGIMLDKRCVGIGEHNQASTWRHPSLPLCMSYTTGLTPMSLPSSSSDILDCTPVKRLVFSFYQSSASKITPTSFDSYSPYLRLPSHPVLQHARQPLHPPHPLIQTQRPRCLPHDLIRTPELQGAHPQTPQRGGYRGNKAIPPAQRSCPRRR